MLMHTCRGSSGPPSAASFPPSRCVLQQQWCEYDITPARVDSMVVSSAVRGRCVAYKGQEQWAAAGSCIKQRPCLPHMPANRLQSMVSSQQQRHRAWPQLAAASGTGHACRTMPANRLQCSAPGHNQVSYLTALCRSSSVGSSAGLAKRPPVPRGTHNTSHIMASDPATRQNTVLPSAIE